MSLFSPLRIARLALAVTLVAAPVAGAHDEDEGDHHHHHHHGVVIQPRNFDHATDLIRDGLQQIGEAVARGDMHALHELSDGVAVPARALGKLAAAKPGSAPANIRAINTLGQDLATLVDAMHVAADSGKSDVVVAKWKDIEGMMPQLDTVAPVPTVRVTWDPKSSSETGKAAALSNPGHLVVTIKDAAGAAMELPADRPAPDLYAVSEDLFFFSHTQAQRRAAGEYASEIDAPYWGREITVFVVTPVWGRQEPYTKRFTVSAPGTNDSAPDYSGPLNFLENSRAIDGYLVRLNGTDHVHAGEPVTLSYLIDQAANPGGVTTEDHLGMPACFSAISKDQRTLVLATNLERAAQGELRVTALFPREGRYVSWLEYKHAGKVITVPFVIDVHGDH